MVTDVATYLRCFQTVPHSTGLPEDSVVNTWAFIGNNAGGRNADAAAINGALDTFYTALKGSLSSAYAWNSGVRDFIDMQDAKPRVPFYTGAVTLGTLTTTENDLPAEVAVVLSFRGARGSGLNAARRRGRVYLGPLQRPSGDIPIFSNTVVDSWAGHANTLKSNLAAANVTWAIYSPYTHHGVPVGEDIQDYPLELVDQLDDAFVPVETIWIDNAWDVQRRRGPKATYRKTL